MKILFVCNEYPPAITGGIGTFTRGLGEALASRGHEVHVVGLYDVASVQHEHSNGVHISRLPATKGRRGVFADRMALRRELRLISSHGSIDVVEAPDFEGVTAGLSRCSQLRIVRLHGSHRYFSDERNVAHSAFIALCEKIALRQADAILSVSDYTARRTQNLFGLSAEILTVHNAVNVPAHYPRKSDYCEQKRAVYFGTLAEKKGVLALAEAWRGFHQTHPDWRLTLIGRDSIHAGRSVKEAMLDLLGSASNSIEFAGFMPNEQVMAQLASFDFAVLPSYSEAFALAPMESMALGLPVVFSMMSSGPELINDGVDGWLCDPRSIENLHQSLSRAAASAQERQRIGSNARATVEGRFSYDKFIDRNISLYESLLARQGRAA